MKKTLPFLILFLVSLLFYACATTGPGGRKSVILISSEQEVSIGKQMAEQVAKEYKILKDVGDVVARHGARRLQQVIGINILLDISLGKSSEAVKQGVTIGIGLMLQGFSRENELEADYDAVYYMPKAGYNPQGMVELLKKLNQLDKSGSNVIEKLAADHPPTVKT